MIDQVREALSGYGPMHEVEMPGGVVFEWDGDAVASVQNGVPRVRVEGGWATVTGDLDAAIRHAAEVVLAECVAGWHEEIRALGPDSRRAMLALVRHDPEREPLQRLLLDLTHRPEVCDLAVICLGHVGRIDRQVLPEVVPRLEELLGDPVLGGAAEDSLGDIEGAIHPFRLWQQTAPWVVIAPPGDAEVARQVALAGEGEVVVVPNAEKLPALREHVARLVREVEDRTHTMGDELGFTMPDPTKPNLHFVLEHDGDIAALQPQLNDWQDLVAVTRDHYLLVW